MRRAPAPTGPEPARTDLARAGSWVAAGLIAICGAWLVWSRVVPVGNSLWGDELHSVMAYILPGPGQVWGGYTANDHMLFELLTWATRRVGGDYSDAAYRLWGVLPGLAGVGVLTVWVWRRLGRWTAVVFVVLVATAPVHMMFSWQARGYGLGFLAGALLLVGADTMLWGRRRAAQLTFAAGGLVGILTLPTFVLPFTGTVAAMLVKRDRRRDVLVTAAIVGALALVFYIPVLSDLVSSGSQITDEPLAWHGFLTGPFTLLLGPQVQLYLPGLDATVAAAVAAAFVLAGLAVLWRVPERILVGLIAAPTLLTFTLLEAAGISVADRFVSWLLLTLLVPVAVAITAAGRAAVAAVPRLAVPAVALLVVASAFALRQSDDLFTSQTMLPLEDWRGAAEIAEGAGIHHVVTNSVAANNLHFYDSDAVRVAPDQLARLFCSNAGPFVYVQNDRDSPTVDPECLMRRGLRPIPVVQVRGAMTVWMAPGPEPGAHPVWCRAVTRRGRPVPAGGRALALHRPATVRLHGAPVEIAVRRIGLVETIPTGRRAGPYEAPSRFVAVEYRLTNRSDRPVLPAAVDRTFGITGVSDHPILPVGTRDPACAGTANAFAARSGLAPPRRPAAPGASVVTAGLYPLATGVASGPGALARYHLAWASPRLGVRLPLDL